MGAQAVTDQTAIIERYKVLEQAAREAVAVPPVDTPCICVTLASYEALCKALELLHKQ
jgi:hypothetical protein